MSRTLRYDMPLLAPGQRNAWASHNEAMIRLEFMLHPWVQGTELTTPPAQSEGWAYSLGSPTVNEWAGHDDEIAISYNGWRFIQPFQGMRIYSREIGPNHGWWYWSGTLWTRRIFNEIALVNLLGINITNPPTQAEANSIKSKINELITACRTAGIIAT